ncbi:hypothetical protein GGS20DRAFT_288182 [Poronia punctata]|nr:hypothetical protein GGS20DRAFT_288182 [Poronia punctata]
MQKAPAVLLVIVSQLESTGIPIVTRYVRDRPSWGFDMNSNRSLSPHRGRAHLQVGCLCLPSLTLFCFVTFYQGSAVPPIRISPTTPRFDKPLTERAIMAILRPCQDQLGGCDNQAWEPTNFSTPHCATVVCQASLDPMQRIKNSRCMSYLASDCLRCRRHGEKWGT